MQYKLLNLRKPDLDTLIVAIEMLTRQVMGSKKEALDILFLKVDHLRKLRSRLKEAAESVPVD